MVGTTTRSPTKSRCFPAILVFVISVYNLARQPLAEIIITTPILIKHIIVRCGSASQMQLLCNFLDLLEQSNTRLNLAYQLLQAQHPLKSGSERYISLILPISLSLSLELARKQVYTSHIHQHPILISFYFLFLSTLS